MAIAIIAVVTVMMAASVSFPAVYAKKHHLTDTEKEDSTASDAQGEPCGFGPDHDQCHDELVRNAAHDDQGRPCTAGPDNNECPDEAWANDS